MALKSITTGKWSTVMRTRKFINLELSIPYYSRVAERESYVACGQFIGVSDEFCSMCYDA